MLVPIESIFIVPAEPDNDLKFAASYVMEEINLMSGIRPSIADPTLIPNSQYAIIIAWHNEDNYLSQDSYALSFNETSTTISSACFADSFRPSIFSSITEVRSSMV